MQSTTDPESGQQSRDGKPNGFYYSEHRTVDSRRNVIVEDLFRNVVVAETSATVLADRRRVRRLVCQIQSAERPMYLGSVPSLASISSSISGIGVTSRDSAAVHGEGAGGWSDSVHGFGKSTFENVLGDPLRVSDDSIRIHGNELFVVYEDTAVYDDGIHVARGGIVYQCSDGIIVDWA